MAANPAARGVGPLLSTTKHRCPCTTPSLMAELHAYAWFDRVVSGLAGNGPSLRDFLEHG